MQLLLFNSRDMSIIELLTVNANTYSSVNTKINTSYLWRSSQYDNGEYYHWMVLLPLMKNNNHFTMASWRNGWILSPHNNFRKFYVWLDYDCYLFFLDTPQRYHYLTGGRMKKIKLLLNVRNICNQITNRGRIWANT